MKLREDEGLTVAEEEKPPGVVNNSVSDDVLLARTRVHYAMTIVAGILVSCVGLGLLALMAVPLAHAIAGRHTDFTFSVSISLNAVLTATSALAGTGLAIQTRRVRHHRNRARELEEKVKGQDEILNTPETGQQDETEAR